MYGAEYAWILHETIGRTWWKHATNECGSNEIAEATENVLIVSSHNRIVDGAHSISGLVGQKSNHFLLISLEKTTKKSIHLQTNRMFNAEMRSMNVSNSRYAPQTYDAVWAIALAMRGAEQQWRNSSLPSTLDNFDYSRHDMTLEFLHQFNRLKFQGVSVRNVKELHKKYIKESEED